jgi:hypothetical protein
MTTGRRGKGSIVRRMGRRVLSSVLVAASALALAAAAAADKEQIHLTSAGQAGARGAVLTKADFAGLTGWTGGALKPDLSSTLPCPDFQPKQSDLVLNGAARTVFKHPGIQIESVAQVLQTPRMVLLDWQRTVLPPQLLPCLRTVLEKSMGSRGRVVSIRRVAFPHVATYAAAIRILMSVTSGASTVQVFSDVVLVGRGSTEITLTTTAPLLADAAVRPFEVRLARLLVGRIRA